MKVGPPGLYLLWPCWSPTTSGDEPRLAGGGCSWVMSAAGCTACVHQALRSVPLCSLQAVQAVQACIPCTELGPLTPCIIPCTSQAGTAVHAAHERSGAVLSAAAAGQCAGPMQSHMLPCWPVPWHACMHPGHNAHHMPWSIICSYGLPTCLARPQAPLNHSATLHLSHAGCSQAVQGEGPHQVLLD